MQKYNKFWVSLALVVVLMVLNNVNFGLSAEVVAQLTTWLMPTIPVGVWLVPNKEPAPPVVTEADYVSQVRDAAETQELG